MQTLTVPVDCTRVTDRASPVVANLGLLNSGGVPISVDWIDWKAEDDCGAKILPAGSTGRFNQTCRPALAQSVVLTSVRQWPVKVWRHCTLRWTQC